jgi:type I restriction enzyme S subunit
MEMRPGYKQTEVGVIPEEWDCAPIASVARLESGHTPSKKKPSYWGGSVQWVSLHDTAALEAREIGATAKTITEDGLKHSSARLLPPGTVVFSRTATVGKTTVMATSMATSQDFANYICGPHLHNHFLVYLFRSMGRTWQRLMAGSIHNTIYMPVFKALAIALPPVAEQRAIAAALNDVDALLGGLDRLIGKKRDLKQAAMQQLLTGQTRLPGFRGEWEVKRLGDVGTFLKGSGVRKDDAQSGNLPCVRYGEIYTHHNDYIKSFNSWISPEVAATATRLRQGDLLFAGSGETKEEIGKCVAFVEDREAYAGGDIVILRAAGVSPMFMGYYCNTAPIAAQKASKGQGDAVVHISRAALSTIIVRLPSLPEQTAIASVLFDIDAELSALEGQRDKTRALKQGMMQELLTGRTRLVSRESANA